MNELDELSSTVFHSSFFIDNIHRLIFIDQFHRKKIVSSPHHSKFHHYATCKQHYDKLCTFAG